MNKVIPFPKHRQHTLNFLSLAGKNAPVLLTAELDMSRVQLSREGFKQQGHSVSYITLLMKSVSQVVAEFPLANSIFQSGFFNNKIVLFEKVVAKFVLDKVDDSGQRLVATATVDDCDQLLELQIQQILDGYKRANYATSDLFAKVRKLNQLPLVVGRLLYRLMLMKASFRQSVQGSFTISSLGHQPINQFVPISANTLTFGAGSVSPKVVVIDGKTQTLPTMTLSMVFDHRVMDGALASEILTRIKYQIENYSIESNVNNQINPNNLKGHTS
ncbi:MAG: pyruvate/2-oxoglutarate dehydrogenase complex dihydrolipoamide acyltransferase (E2) component [Arenicella sp.]|jgi:pyruvate/2-oxoglutarate dehydrogenase complex dihydrolipoamide acyltransferase (E2) component